MVLTCYYSLKQKDLIGLKYAVSSHSQFEATIASCHVDVAVSREVLPQVI